MPTAHEHLAAFVRHHRLAHDDPKHEGVVEKGSGSKFSKLSDEDKKRHAALEELVEAEAKVAHARHALTVAEAHHAAVAKRAGVELDAPDEETPVDDDQADAPRPEGEGAGENEAEEIEG